MQQQPLWIPLAFALSFCGGCTNDARPPEPPVGTNQARLEPVEQVNVAFAQLAQQQAAEAVQAALVLAQASAQMLADTNATTLVAAQTAWRQAAHHIETLHVFHHLTAVSGGRRNPLAELQQSLATWPITPGYLDAYGEHPYSGLVFDIGLPVTEQLLREQHGLTAASDATLGIYAIEFLLFGEDGQRDPQLFKPIAALSEQQQAQGYEHVGELPHNRRRQLLHLQTQLLVKDLQQLQQYWTARGLAATDADFARAARAMLTEQITELAQLQISADKRLPAQQMRQSQGLAARLEAQLSGWQAGMGRSTLTQKELLEENTQSAVMYLQKIAQESEQTQPQLHQLWQQVYERLRNLATALTPTAEQGAPAVPTIEEVEPLAEQALPNAPPPAPAPG